jgi:hypothetical protein
VYTFVAKLGKCYNTNAKFVGTLKVTNGLAKCVTAFPSICALLIMSFPASKRKCINSCFKKSFNNPTTMLYFAISMQLGNVVLAYRISIGFGNS